MQDELIEPIPPEHPVLVVLISDLQAAFPELDAGELLDRARRDFPALDIQIDGEEPALRLREPSADGRADSSSDPCLELTLDPSCLPAGGRTDGWFARHVFRIGRVHEEARRIMMALDRKTPEPLPCLGYALGRLKTIRGGQDKIRECIQRALTRVIEKASQFDCGEEFCRWFLRILSTTTVDVIREDRPWFQVDLDLDINHPLIVDELPDDEPLGMPSDWIEKVLSGLAEEDIDVQANWFESAARLDLEHRGIKDPSDVSVERWSRYLYRLYLEWMLKHRKEFDFPKEDVPLNHYELYVAYGLHQDFRKELGADDPVSVVLEDVQVGIEQIIEFQTTKDRGEARWRSVPGQAAGPVERLAEIQTATWKEVAGRPESSPAWKAARNLQWFSWHLKAAATLAACLRYAERCADPALRPLSDALRPLDCLRSFPRENRKSLSGFLPIVDQWPVDSHADSEGVSLLMRMALRRACLASTGRGATATNSGFPEGDWDWWISRVTGRGCDRADATVRRLAVKAGLVHDYPDRS